MGSKQGFRAVTFAVVIAAGAFGLVTSAGAQGWHHGGGNDVMAIMHRLDLTAQQKTQIHALMEANRQATESTRQQLRAVSGQIETTMFSTGSVSSTDVMPLLQQQEQLRATLDQARLTTALGVRAILTPAQLQQASSLHAQLASLHQQEHSLMSPSDAASGGSPQ